LDGNAFFFQGDTLLLPEDFPDSMINIGIPFELSKDFDRNTLDIFDVPAINEPPSSPPKVIRAVSVPAETVLPRGWRGVPVRRVLTLFANSNFAGKSNIAGQSVSAGQGVETGALIRACHIAQWRQSSRFCGTCGEKNNDVRGEAQRVCPKCGRIEFPRICPAVIVIITDDKDRILLAHNKKFKAGMYSLIAGFNEAGESLESTVVREIREEVSIEVSGIIYVKSQPWPFPNSLMIGFKARYFSGTVKPDGDEIEDAAWFERGNLPELPAEGSLSRYLINSWLTGAL